MIAEKSFFHDVYEVVKKIPAGFVMSYGTVALAAGRPKASRIVGSALHKNTDPENIPCHRVVFKDGSLAEGYVFGGKEIQYQMLKSEGVLFKENGKVDMEKCSI